MGESGTEPINLVKVCHMLTDEFSTRELLSLCSELGIDGVKLELEEDPPRIETVIALVAHLSKRSLVPALLVACNRRRPGVADDMLLRRPSVEWTPRKVPKRVVGMVSDLLGIKGEIYSCLEEAQPVETGCVCWRIDVDARGDFVPVPGIDAVLASVRELLAGDVDAWDGLAPVPNIDAVLANVRELLAGETVIAYKGDMEWGWGDRLSSRQIVVAATNDQFDILRIERTEAVNAHLDTAELIYELQRIDEKYGIDILGAGGGAVEFVLQRALQAEEAQEFRRWLLWLDLAPDLVPHGEELSSEFLARPIGLWWD